MAYVHIAMTANSQQCIMANATTLGGHVVVEDFAFIGGLVAVHQFARIGAHSMIGVSALSRRTSLHIQQPPARGPSFTG